VSFEAANNPGIEWLDPGRKVWFKVEQLQLKFSIYCVSKRALCIIILSEFLYIFVLSAGMNKCIFSEFQAYGPSVSLTAIDLTHTLGPLVPQL